MIFWAILLFAIPFPNFANSNSKQTVTNVPVGPHFVEGKPKGSWKSYFAGVGTVFGIQAAGLGTLLYFGNGIKNGLFKGADIIGTHLQNIHIPAALK